MKKIISILLSAILICSSFSCVSASNENVEVYLNGNKMYFDVQPQIINGRTMVPMRKIFEAMDCEVVWHSDLQQIVVWQNDEVLMNLEIGRYTMDLFDYGEKTLDVPPMIIGDRTMVPLRAVSESIGADVEWSQTERTVTITYKKSTTNKYQDYNDYDDYDDSDDYDDDDTTFGLLNHIDYSCTSDSGFYKIDGTVTDIGDNVHQEGLLFKITDTEKLYRNKENACAEVVYDLNNEYSSLSGYICPIKEVNIKGLEDSLSFEFGSRSWYNAFKKDNQYIVEFYDNNKLIYKSPTIIGNNVNTFFDVDISDVSKLKIKVCCTEPAKYFNNSAYGYIALTSLELN